MIIAKSDEPCDDWQYDQQKENYLLSLLNNTIYSEEKKKSYESVIANELSQDKYESLKLIFWNDSIDDVTQRGTYSMTALHRHLRKLQ